MTELVLLGKVELAIFVTGTEHYRLPPKGAVQPVERNFISVMIVSITVNLQKPLRVTSSLFSKVGVAKFIY